MIADVPPDTLMLPPSGLRQRRWWRVWCLPAPLSIASPSPGTTVATVARPHRRNRRQVLGCQRRTEALRHVPASPAGTSQVGREFRSSRLTADPRRSDGEVEDVEVVATSSTRPMSLDQQHADAVGATARRRSPRRTRINEPAAGRQQHGARAASAATPTSFCSPRASPRLAMHGGGPSSARAVRPSWSTSPTVALSRRGDPEVFLDGEVGEEHHVLPRAHQTSPRPAVRGLGGEVVAVEVDVAGHRHEAADSVDQRGLAGTVRADHPDDLTGADAQRDLVERLQTAEAHRDLVGREHHRSVVERALDPRGHRERDCTRCRGGGDGRDGRGVDRRSTGDAGMCERGAAGWPPGISASSCRSGQSRRGQSRQLGPTGTSAEVSPRSSPAP